MWSCTFPRQDFTIFPHFYSVRIVVLFFLFSLIHGENYNNVIHSSTEHAVGEVGGISRPIDPKTELSLSVGASLTTCFPWRTVPCINGHGDTGGFAKKFGLSCQLTVNWCPWSFSFDMSCSWKCSLWSENTALPRVLKTSSWTDFVVHSKFSVANCGMLLSS